jgi:two-component system, LytTR family, response regulator
MAIKQYRCIIVDDDEIDRLTTLSFVKKYPLLALAGTYSNAEEAYNATVDNLPDIAFLDVDMPGMSGLALRKRLTDIPACIFITSYSDYAVESFELAALDYIVKPIKAERFAKTVERIQHFFITKEKAHLLDHTLGADSIIIKDGLHQKKIHLHQILYLEALKDYTSIVTTSGKHCVLSSIGNLLKEVSFQSFVRIHKSYAVQKHFIEKIKGQEVFFQNISLPIGRAYKDALEVFK